MAIRNLQVILNTKLLQLVLVTCIILFSLNWLFYNLTKETHIIYYTPLTEEINEPPIKVNSKLNNLEHFSFLHSPDCADCFAIAIVPTLPENTGMRHVIRKTLGGTYGKYKFKAFFLLGHSEAYEQLLNQEFNENGDLVIGNFEETPFNVTYKHVMGLRWVATTCPQAKYIIKVDEDVLVNSYELITWLVDISPYGAENLLACELMKKNKVGTSTTLDLKMYGDFQYPPHCEGHVIVYSQDVIRKLYASTYITPYFWMDNIYVTGFLADNAKVPITDISKLIATSEQRFDSSMKHKHGNVLFIYPSQ